MRNKDIVHGRRLTVETQIRRRIAGKGFTQSLSDISRVLVGERTDVTIWLWIASEPGTEGTTRSNISLWVWNEVDVAGTLSWWHEVETYRILPRGISVSKIWIKKRCWHSGLLMTIPERDTQWEIFMISSPFYNQTLCIQTVFCDSYQGKVIGSNSSSEGIDSLDFTR